MLIVFLFNAHIVFYKKIPTKQWGFAYIKR